MKKERKRAAIVFVITVSEFGASLGFVYRKLSLAGLYRTLFTITALTVQFFAVS